MTGPKCTSPLLVATASALIASVSSLATAQAQDTRTIAKNASIFIDGKALTIRQGTSKDDVGAQVAKLGAREMGPGAIVFRANDTLYVVDAPPLAPLALNDPAAERQRSYGGLNDDRQRSYGGLNDDRQRSYGGLNDRQQSYGGFYDSGAEWRRQQSYGGLYDRQQSYGGMYDPDYANYKLKKVFDEVWGTSANK